MNHYRQMIQMALLAVIVAASTACASDTHIQRDPLRPVSDCIDLSSNPEVYAPSNKTVIVKTGPKYYRVDLANNCGVLNAATLNFKAAADKRGMQRMCGELGDQIINADGMHCVVKNITMVNKKQFKELEAQSKARQ